ncbi:hypothetical protein [Campylobacter sp. MIT 12-8780]|uniref:hypothetical protein n=1 Tax=Campylobacter sp. MIT 12-8780 TaxID=2202200 RepID=UPI0021AFE10E|nr:hypothetical protein [Campylobacter sp. MIT 12-8780]
MSKNLSLIASLFCLSSSLLAEDNNTSVSTGGGITHLKLQSLKQATTLTAPDKASIKALLKTRPMATAI